MLKLSKTNTVALSVKLRLPTANPNAFNEGSITAQVYIKTKEELADLSDAGTTDIEYINELLVSVEGLGDDNGNAISGDAAVQEVKTGVWSAHLQAGILQAYFEQFGEARVKNSKPSRSR